MSGQSVRQSWTWVWVAGPVEGDGLGGQVKLWVVLGRLWPAEALGAEGVLVEAP